MNRLIQNIINNNYFFRDTGEFFAHNTVKLIRSREKVTRAEILCDKKQQNSSTPITLHVFKTIHFIFSASKVLKNSF